MKPITLSPGQLDAALGLPVRPAWCWGDGWCDGAPCTCAHPDQPPAVSVRTRLDNLSPLQVDHLRNVLTVTKPRKPRRGRGR